MPTRISSIYTLITADDSPLKRGLRRARSESVKGAKAIQTALNKINFRAVSLGATAMGGTIAIATKKFVDMAIEQENVEKRLAAVLKATGEAAGFNIQQLKEMASSMQAVTTTGDEVILSGQAILATFKQIRGEAFERATMAALDLSEVMQQDLQTSIVQVGKALNDPIANLGALGRAGIQFTKDQKDLIKQLWETGRAAEAQNIILKELESQFGGAARAAKETFGGSVKSLKNTLGDLGEDIGEAVIPPIKDIVESMSAWIAENEKLLSQDLPGFIRRVGEAVSETLTVIGKMDKALGVAFGGKAAKPIIELHLEQLRKTEKKYENQLELLEDVGATGTAAYEKTGQQLDLVREKIKLATEEHNDFLRQKHFPEGSITGDKYLKKVEENIDAHIKAWEKYKKSLINVDETVKNTATAIKSFENLRFSPRQDRGAMAPKAGGMVGAMSVTELSEKANRREIKLTADRANAYRNMYEDISDQAGNYYEEQIKNLKGQKEAYIQLTKDKKLAEQWFSNEYEKILIESQRKSDDFIKGVSAGFKQLTREQYTWGQAGYDIVQEFARTSSNIMSDVFFDHFTGELDSLSDYWDSMWRSMLRTYTNALGEMASQWALSGLSDLIFGGAGGGGGGGIGGFIEDVFDAIFHKGGMIKAHSGMALKRDEVPVIAQTGEGILSRQGMNALGGEKFLNALNRGQSLNGAAISYNITINESDNPKATVAEFERFIRSNRGRALMQYTSRGF